MAAALSPRNPAPRLTSTVRAQWGTPRREMSKAQRRALAQGYTLRVPDEYAQAHLHRGIVHRTYPTAN